MPSPRARRPPAHDGSRAGAASDRLHLAAIHLLRRLRKEDDRTGLSAPRLSALSVIVFGGPITLGALAAAEQVKPPTMTRLVSALEALGLVAREGDPADARLVRIRATARGRSLLMKGRQRRVERLTRRLAGLDAADLATLEEATAILVDRVLPEL